MNPALAPSLSVVVVAYAAGETVTQGTVEALVADTSYPHETVVLLNASPSLSRGQVEAWGLPLRIEEVPENLGYAGAINWGLDHAEADVVGIINDDARAEPGALGAMMAAFGVLAKSRISAVTASIINEGEEEESKNGTLNLAGRIIPARFADRTQVLYPSGAAMLLRRDLPFRADAEYFLYYEDVLLGLTARLAGYRPVMAPDAKFHHQHHASMHTIDAEELQFIRERNRLLTLWTIFEDATLHELEPYWRQERELLRLAALMGKGKYDAVKRADAWMAAHQDTVRIKREAIQKLRDVEDEALLQYFSYRLLPAHIPGATVFNRRAKQFCESHGILTWDIREESKGKYPLPRLSADFRDAP